MNFLQTDQTLFANKRELEMTIVSRMSEKQLYEAKVRWLANTIEELQIQLKQFNQE